MTPETASVSDAADGASLAERQDGKELFRQLLRLFPGANHEDYYKAGVWTIETLQIDLALLEAHRKEAGAPEPIPLSEVVMPTIASKPQPMMPLQQRPASSLLTSRPAMSIGRLGVPGVAASSLAAAAKPRPPGIVSGSIQGSPSAPLSGGIGRGPTMQLAEMNRIAQFVMKWKLEPRYKITLGTLDASHRKWVMENFDGSTSLEHFVKNSKNSHAWMSAKAADPSATALKMQATSRLAATSMASSASSPAAMGIKRTFTSAVQQQPVGSVAIGLAAKRPRLLGASGLSTGKAGQPQPPSQPPSAGTLLRASGITGGSSALKTMLERRAAQQAAAKAGGNLTAPGPGQQPAKARPLNPGLLGARASYGQPTASQGQAPAAWSGGALRPGLRPMESSRLAALSAARGRLGSLVGRPTQPAQAPPLGLASARPAYGQASSSSWGSGGLKPGQRPLLSRRPIGADGSGGKPGSLVASLLKKV